MISVIVPTLNEEANIGCCIRNVRAEGAGIEVVVSDGGSSDKTVEAAYRSGADRVVRGKTGRGPQMNAGAADATGDILVFLHADTRLEPGWRGELITAIEDGAPGGAFAFSIENPGFKYRLTEIWVRLRCGIFRLPYGDQAIFMRRDVFEALGGYRDIPLMEDVELIGRMKKKGRITILKKRAFTHDRRWEESGWLRTSLLNQVIMILYRLGVHPRRLVRLYYR